MANVNRLLHGAERGVDLLSQLDPLPQERAELKAAKKKIRDHLRKTFAAAGRQALGHALVPHFFTQGSDAYKTLNRLPRMPPQQMDFDDGLYVPMSFVQRARPSVAAKALFKFVDAALLALAKQERWGFDDGKPTCVRLVISAKAHIDIPLYAIPDDEFKVMAKAVQDRAMMVADLAVDIDQDTWESLDTDRVLLAHRDEDWKPSDPRKIHIWFRDAVALYGEQIRRQCRYLKAWRDHHDLKNVCSLLIMVCVWKVYEEIGRRNMPTRDDLALAKIASRLPRLIRREVENPTDPEEKLDARMSADDRHAAVAKAAELADHIDSIVEHCYSADGAIQILQNAFGGRIAHRPDLVVIEQPAKEVLTKAPAYVAAPEVGRSRSG